MLISDARMDSMPEVCPSVRSMFPARMRARRTCSLRYCWVVWRTVEMAMKPKMEMSPIKPTITMTDIFVRSPTSNHFWAMIRPSRLLRIFLQSR